MRVAQSAEAAKRARADCPTWSLMGGGVGASPNEPPSMGCDTAEIRAVSSSPIHNSSDLPIPQFRARGTTPRSKSFCPMPNTPLTRP